jgi:hypothetical protein
MLIQPEKVIKHLDVDTEELKKARCVRKNLHVRWNRSRRETPEAVLPAPSVHLGTNSPHSNTTHAHCSRTLAEPRQFAAQNTNRNIKSVHVVVYKGNDPSEAHRPDSPYSALRKRI